MWDWLKKRVLNNARWKLVSLLLASLVYFSIRAGVSDVRTITVPVEIDEEVKQSNAKNSAAIASYDPPSVQVTVRGSFNDVQQAAQNNPLCILRPRLRVSNPTEDTLWLDIGRSNLRGLSRSLRILKIEPHVAKVEFALSQSKQFAIATPLVEGKARGRVELSTSIETAVVRGPQKLIKTLDEEKVKIQCEPINVEGRAQTYVATVKLLPPGAAPTATVEPSTMNVTVTITAETGSRHIEHARVFVAQPYAAQTRWKLEPDWVDYDIKGRVEVVNSVTEGQILFSVDAFAPRSDALTNELPVRVHIQQGLAIDEVIVMPQTVKLISLPLPAPPVPPESTPPAAGPAAEKGTKEEAAKPKTESTKPVLEPEEEDDIPEGGAVLP
ncbi:MAG: hypothetical protein J5985_04950 [Kiritimatiellae bacterium]|nr:hypothetical protein [Kiritimatiellia bacterium]